MRPIALVRLSPWYWGFVYWTCSMCSTRQLTGSNHHVLMLFLCLKATHRQRRPRCLTSVLWLLSVAQCLAGDRLCWHSVMARCVAVVSGMMMCGVFLNSLKEKAKGPLSKAVLYSTTADYSRAPGGKYNKHLQFLCCLLYTSPSPRDGLLSRMPSSA